MKTRPLSFIALLLTSLFFTAPANAASPITGTNRPTVVSGQKNGEVDAGLLVYVHSGCRVAKDAAPSLVKMLAAAKADGVALSTNDCYRELSGQISVAILDGAGNSACAATFNTSPSGKPVGTSMHGWGKAVDFRYGASSGFDTAGYRWMKANAAAYGWNHPALAEPGGSSCPEPWHWEWVGDGGQAAADPVRADVAGVIPSGRRQGLCVGHGLGAVKTAGSAVSYGSMAGQTINWTMVGAAAHASNRQGYWMVGGDGGIFSFGDAGIPRINRINKVEPARRRYDVIEESGAGLLDGCFRRRHLQFW